MTREQKFFNALRDVFVGAKVEGESGYINLMRIKSRYYEKGVFPRLQQDINEALKPFPAFRDELFEKLYDFFHRYFSESGSIYFRYTPLHQNVYEKVYTDDKDVMLFWKTHMLYYVKTDRLFRTEPQKIGLLTDSVSQTDRFYKKSDRAYRSIDLLVQRILDYFSVVPQEFERLKKLEEEINHFKNINVSLKDISDLAGKIELVHQFEDPEAIKMKLRERLERKEIDLDQYTAGIEKAARMVREAAVEYQGKHLKIRHVANHYYIPIILSGETERIDYIKHIIQEDSEIKFLNRLEECLTRPSNRFQDFDWWLFSKLDENLDEVYIPYYDGSSNKVREFKPDFIFWLQKGNTYFVVFIDPKGTVHTDYERKIDGYSQIFESSGHPKTIAYGGKEAKVFAFLYTDDVDRLSKGYKRYWFDHIDKALASVESST